MGALEVIDGGLFTTVQDEGRSGYRKYGVPVSGVMDSHAYNIANWLVGNKQMQPVLELTLQGGKFRFKDNAVLAVTGADMDAVIKDKTLSLNTTIYINKGDILEFKRARKGCRTYLAIRGTWMVDKVMGSYSTYTTGNFGGLQGRKLKSGDMIEWKEYRNSATEDRSVPRELIPYYSKSISVRVIPGPEWNLLADKQKEVLLSSEYVVSSQSNRMGIRLEGKKPELKEAGNMASSPVVSGIVQLPESGKPLVLMKDAQTVGGYPRILKVIEADLWRMAQLLPGGALRFEMIDIEEAFSLNNHMKDVYRENFS